jgi:hypothetical protein
MLWGLKICSQCSNCGTGDQCSNYACSKINYNCEINFTACLLPSQLQELASRPQGGGLGYDTLHLAVLAFAAAFNVG